MINAETVQTIELLKGFKQLGETLRQDGFTESYNPEAIFGRIDEPKNDLESNIVYFSNMLPAVYSAIQYAPFKKGQRVWADAEKSYLFNFVEFAQGLPGVRKEEGMKNFRNMRFVWEAIDALLKRNVNSVKAFYYGNLPSSEEVKVENSNEEISAPETTPKASAETIIEEFKQAEAAQEPVLETKNELEEQMLQLAKNLKTVPQEKVLGFINFISHFVDENNDLKTENKKLKAQHRQDEYLIEKYDENLKDVANKLESLQQEVQLLRYEARKAGLSLDNKSNNQVTLDNTGMVVDYK